MEGWVKVNCNGCGRPADVNENAAIYKCPFCGSVYERIRQANGRDVLVDLEDAMIRLLSATELLEAEALVHSLPRFISEAEIELAQAQGALDAARSDEAIARARAAQALRSRRDYVLGFGGGAVLALIFAVQAGAQANPLLWLAISAGAILGAWYHYNKWQQMRSQPDVQVQATALRVAEESTHCAEIQDELDQARLHLELRQSQVKNQIRKRFVRPRKPE